MISQFIMIATCAVVVLLLLVASEPLLVLAISGAALYLWLLSGFLVIPAPPERTSKPKVFCIGLSRTGTTSITVALNELGYAAHHQCHALVEHDAQGKPRVNRYWASALDAHADIAPATIFQELMTAYPNARFVLTLREPRAWSRAMVRFCSKFRLLLTCPPVSTMFDDIYGAGWPTYGEDDWARVYAAHEARVAKAFANAPHRLLRLNIMGGDGWGELCDFLDEPRPPHATPFPHADVFKLSATTQVSWQLQRLRKRFGRWLIACLLLIFVLRPAVADHGQCARACRVANARTGAPAVQGYTGDWFATEVSGRRHLLSPSTCSCYRVGGGGEDHSDMEDNGAGGADDRTAGARRTRIADSPPLAYPTVARLHPATETADQWHFQTTSVCGADGREYASAARAKSAGVHVSNCGQCSRCSSLQAVDAMHDRATTLTKRASLAGVIYLLAGESVHWLLMQSWLVGFDVPCADCWLAATQCNLASCAQCAFSAGVDLTPTPYRRALLARRSPPSSCPPRLSSMGALP